MTVRTQVEQPAATPNRPRVVLICHAEDVLNREGLTAWIASLATLVGVVILREPPRRLWRRVRREVRRVGLLRFADVLAFRAFYWVFLRSRDRAWEQEELGRLRRRYGSVPDATRWLEAVSPNTEEVFQFVCACTPDIMIARCKSLLSEGLFSVPAAGTYVMHPGICPEYRNAHGCFWALANGDDERVGMTLLRIDKGVDTGPVYGYYRCDFDSGHESHVVIQHRVVFDNLEAVGSKLLEVASGSAAPLDTSGRESRTWGQPWLSAYLRWKRRANKAAQ